MTDQEQITKLYHDMYRAMVEKNRAELERVHDESFVLLHMTGMRQSKQVYIDSIMNGTLNYYTEETEQLDIQVNGGKAVMTDGKLTINPLAVNVTITGRSRVNAAVFGGGKHTWRLQLKFDLIKRPDGWKLTSAQASTY